MIHLSSFQELCLKARNRAISSLDIFKIDLLSQNKQGLFKTVAIIIFKLFLSSLFAIANFQDLLQAYRFGSFFLICMTKSHIGLSLHLKIKQV